MRATPPTQARSAAHGLPGHPLRGRRPHPDDHAEPSGSAERVHADERAVGISRAMEWVATGRVFDADEALQGGLVRSLHPPEQLLDAAYALAREIADNTAPVSVALARRLMWTMLGADHPMQAHRADSR